MTKDEYKKIMRIRSSIRTELHQIVKRYFYEYCKYIVDENVKDIDKLAFRVHVSNAYTNKRSIPRTLMQVFNSSKTCKSIYETYGIIVKLSNYEFRETSKYLGYEELRLEFSLHENSKQTHNFFEFVSII